MRSDYTQAYINRGDILIKLNRTKDAQEVYERALLYDSTNPDIYYNVSICSNIDSFTSSVSILFKVISRKFPQSISLLRLYNYNFLAISFAISVIDFSQSLNSNEEKTFHPKLLNSLNIFSTHIYILLL